MRQFSQTLTWYMSTADRTDNRRLSVAGVSGDGVIPDCSLFYTYTQTCVLFGQGELTPPRHPSKRIKMHPPRPEVPKEEEEETDIVHFACLRRCTTPLGRARGGRQGGDLN